MSMSDFRLISADSHFVEPPNMWAERIDKKFRDRAPHTVKGLGGREGEFFVCENVTPMTVAGFFGAGVPSAELPEEALLPAPAEPPSEIDTLKAKIAELEKSVELYKDQFLRKAADFENFKKRMENEFINITSFANEALIAEILPVLDDLTRSLTAGKARREFGAFYKGVELIHSKLMKILEARGLKPIEALGKEFNVDYHEALMQMPKENVPAHTVIEEVEKGYTLHDKVIRHSKVIVAGNSEDSIREKDSETHEKKDEMKGNDEKSGKENQ
jgi:molecular chaperone GrpE